MVQTFRLRSVETPRVAETIYSGASIIRNCLLLDPAVGLCLGPYGGPRGVAVSYQRGTPVSVLEGTGKAILREIYGNVEADRGPAGGAATRRGDCSKRASEDCDG